MVTNLPIIRRGSPLRNKGAREKAAAARDDKDHAGSTSQQTSATINEALRNNPFGTSLRARAADGMGERHAEKRTVSSDSLDNNNNSSGREDVLSQVPADTRVFDREAEERAQELDELNKSLRVLAHLFPDIRVEVFRELLMRFDGESRLHVCVEQLLRHKKQWVQGRWKLQNDSGGEGCQSDGNEGGDGVALEELFRSDQYRNAVKAVLCKEFSGLSRSAIEAVLAEVNFSYSRARPTLRDLSRKGWRATLSSLNPFKRKKDNKDDNPLVVWDKTAGGNLLPRLKKTGSDELDGEVHGALIAPLLLEQKETQEFQDFQLALQLNENEAKMENALYECQCCLDDVAFEQISTCSSHGHVICFSCIRRTMHEALFGQGWDNSVDSARSTLKCVAPVSHGVCDGYLSPALTKQAILLEKAGSETFLKFEERVASEAILKSKLKLVRCPFCAYAEVDPVFHPPSQTLLWQFRRGNLLSTILTTIFLLDLIPLLVIPLVILCLFYPDTIAAIFRTSLQNMGLRSRNKRFLCKNPSCQRTSCMTCQKTWRDPHSCEEPLQQSLRTTVEAARTAAIKRTCPRCNLSFVKSSGCNKLTCVCGYSMCYLCRKALNGSSRRPRQLNGAQYGPAADNNPIEQDAADEDGGYKHFCEHFRVNPGTRCSECNKCELYLAEDEEEIARRAGEKAEREWRLRQSLNTNPKTSTTPSTSPSTSTSTGSLWTPDSTQQQQQQQHLLNSVLHSAKATHGWRNHPWRYWLNEVWRDERWQWEVQAAADMIIEKVIVVNV
ncbi:hypothetical protein BGW36DRAFT_389518 [Talaromyces proteolyticus]|uniref:RING-type domain-containing protein n=1 Tax=Talaromyces proteolyticus TaxID=1131652 RepID=A0AAD4PW01_9EURO|nr:uncharacterized protein BGW36DRAFT_389518 [Talaromyces proteolyticus]KAH8690880.1 hypothetical protein BGW36DRAFT_389518 [Talaromyces proteolyticus]